jgi:ribosomal protein S18 acetylase RimI-like enzyme
MLDVIVVPAERVPADVLRAFLAAAWHGDSVVAHGERLRPADLPGYAALDADRVVGHASYRIVADSCELTSIAADPPGHGIGSKLMDAVLVAARAAGCTRMWLTTTNDNLDALRFYQRRGFRLEALRPGAVDRAREQLKPELPEIGSHAIPMRDELDLALML